MNKVIEMSIQQAIKLLEATKCGYAIVMPNGERVQNQAFEKSKKIKRGSLLQYYKPFFDNVQVGDVVVIPFAEHDRKALACSATSWCSAHWGNGSYKSCSTDSALEILRCS